MLNAAPFTVADTNDGAVVSAGVLLVAVCAEKFGTGSFSLSASCSLLPVAGAL